MQDKSMVYIFIDEGPQPVAVLAAPVSFELDTRKLIDGKHTLKVISKAPSGKEGIRLIPFEVRNGPAIVLEGIFENAVVDGVVPVMINAHGQGNQHKFLITGSETPQSIPAWIWMLLISFAGWAIFYLIRYFQHA